MMTRHASTFLKPFLITAALFAMTVTTTPSQADNSVELTLTATGVSTAAPDMMTLRGGVITQEKTAAEAVGKNSQTTRAVIEAVKAAGVDKKDIQTAQLSINPRYSYSNNTQTLLGYEARNSVRVNVRNTDDAGKVIDAMVKAGANELNGPSFSFSDPSEMMNEARSIAVKAAKKRAELYAKAAGLSQVQLISLEENGANQVHPMEMMRANVGADFSGAPPVEAGTQDVKINVTAKFKLLP